MLSLTGALALLALQQGFTSPPSGDTTGYWQQRVTYTITARLDEDAQRIRASGTMRYVNNSPDTLRELYVHQYLNAFRPGSKWSQVDTREGRMRFQNLRDPDYGYERFTAPVRVNGTVVAVSYPGAPDSTVARIALPAALLPGDSVLVAFEWDARASTLPRRQGRRGRHWDLAQWYPRIAPYDRGGWQYNALQPAGEFYGEFGDYDVTLVLREDQVVAATGVPVSGDPGWERARRFGVVHRASRAYDGVRPSEVQAPAGFKAVRFIARDVHHFAWSTSPDYRYEGGVFVRPPPPGRVRAWDSVAIHVLYQPGDDTTWGGGRVVQRTANTIGWLETIFGRYAYPQMTVLHRVEGGGTEFPMMQMNGSPSQGLNLHEGGHIWVHGILANNEWRSGWLDEGFTSYQSEWAQGLTPQERVRARIVDRFVEPTGYAARGARMTTSRADAINLGQALADLEGESQPIGTVAHEFRDFNTYNQMIYTRAQVMYGQLRDVLGDSAWVAFLHDYYDRWALKHVDERAMRGSAERVSGKDLGWFFDQWVHRTGVMDYALGDVRQARDGASWVTTATVVKRGEYAHPIRVGVRSVAGWTTVQAADPVAERQEVRIVTTSEPLEVRLDPHHFSWDWNRRNDARGMRPRFVFDWPFLRQNERERAIVAWRPMAWYSDPGAANVAVRVRSSYLDLVDRREFGVAYAARDDLPAENALQGWLRVENPYLPFVNRPLMGWSATAAKLDDVLYLQGEHRTEFKGDWRGWMGGRITYTDVLDIELVPELWSGSTVDYTFTFNPESRTGREFVNFQAVVGVQDSRAYGKGEIALGARRLIGATEVRGRLYAGVSDKNIPLQRAISVSAADPTATFMNRWWRPRGSILKQDYLQGLPLGGPGLRGYHWSITPRGAVGSNLDVGRVVYRSTASNAPLTWRLHGFADGAALISGPEDVFVDAGVALSVAGRIFDRDIRLRLDAPLYVSEPGFAIARSGTIAWRYVLTFTDIWPN